MKDTNYNLPETIHKSLSFPTDCIDQLNFILRYAEEVEEELSYISPCKTEYERKQLGSYYTPADVADFFWRELFIHNGILDSKDAVSFLNRYHFIEPAAGAGALIFALLKKFIELGVTTHQLAGIDLSVIDVNKNAISFIESQIDHLSKAWGVEFVKIKFIHADFIKHDLADIQKPYFFFGNPPFFANSLRTSPWKNIYADFLEKSINFSGTNGGIHFIVPLSITFSRDYTSLRKSIMGAGGAVLLSNFDNIPDTLFKSGKPSHTNTNKSNSQRCTILSILPEKPNIILSTPLLRWSKKERSTLLGQSPKYYDVSRYRFDGQFPRPQSTLVLDYLESATESPRLESLLVKKGSHNLFIGGVARNYISLRENTENGVHTLSFNSERDFLLGIGLLGSDLFFSYWLTLGDGFHVTKGNISKFPLYAPTIERCIKNVSKIRAIWNQRQRFQKGKLNSGKMTTSYDLTGVLPSLLDV